MGIIFFKQKYFSKANKESDQFLRVPRQQDQRRSFSQRGPCAQPGGQRFKAVYTDESKKDKNEIKRSEGMRQPSPSSSKISEFSYDDRVHNTVIGLFGTVWGIMNAFTVSVRQALRLLPLLLPA
jgi:hypothetical protein